MIDVQGTNTADVIRNDVHAFVPQIPNYMNTCTCTWATDVLPVLCVGKGISHNSSLPDV